MVSHANPFTNFAGVYKGIGNAHAFSHTLTIYVINKIHLTHRNGEKSILLQTLVAKQGCLEIYYFDVDKSLDVYMSLKAMYNEITDHYTVADRFGSISDSHRVAIEQIKREHLGLRPGYKVLDFGVGNGAFLEKLRHNMPAAEFTGIDISPEMLAKARRTVPLTAIEGSATEASHYLPHHSQDLVLAHFINAYVPIHTLFNEADLLTRANGHFSLITTTYESFPVAQQNLAEFIASDSLISSVVGHYYKAMVKNTTVASGLDELLHVFAQHQFNVIQHQRLRIPITLYDIDELALFGIEGTWFLNSISMRMLPRNFLIERLKRLFSKIFTFPYHDTHIIDVVLAKK